MTQADITAVASAVAATILIIVQTMQGTKIADNHEMTHERIEVVESAVMDKTTVAAHISALSKRIDALEGKHRGEDD